MQYLHAEKKAHDILIFVYTIVVLNCVLVEIVTYTKLYVVPTDVNHIYICDFTGFFGSKELHLVYVTGTLD